MISPFWLKVIGVAIVVAALMGAGAGMAAKHYRPIVKGLKDKVDELGGKLKEQNEAVEALREAGALRAKAAQKALDAAEVDRRKAETHAQSLLARQLKPGEDACTAASALIREELTP